MTDAVIVSTARTPLAKSWKGAFNMTHGAELAGHAVRAAVERAGIDGAEVEDVLMGCANPEGATGANIARQAALRAGLPVSVAGLTVNRFCSSGLQTIALAAQRIVAGEGEVYVAGGVESISCVQQEMNQHMLRDLWLAENKPALYMSMLETAETVARRYKIGRERMDRYGAASQQKAAAALAAGLFAAEIAPITVTAGVADPRRGIGTRRVTVSADEGIRPGTTFDSIKDLRPCPAAWSAPATRASSATAPAPASSSAVPMRSGATCSRWGASSASRWPAASPTRWASARCTPCPRCSRGWACAWPTSTCGNSTRRSRCRCSIAPTRWASRPSGSMSTAARSRSATPTASAASA